MSTEGMTCLDDVSDHFSMVMLKIAFTSSQKKGCNLCVDSFFIVRWSIPQFLTSFFFKMGFPDLRPTKKHVHHGSQVDRFLGPSFWHLAFGVTSTEALDDWPFCHSAILPCRSFVITHMKRQQFGT